MFDAATARRMMVDGQVRTADVTSPELIAAMLAVPRELFVPPTLADQAYLDADLPLAKGRVLLRPLVLAKLIQTVRIGEADHVLDVGCGTGYSAAVLSHVAGSVVALEEDAALVHQAQDNLAKIETSHVTVATGPLAAGWSAGAPYDVILLNGAAEVAPDALGRQLKPNGRLVCIFGRAPPLKGTIFRLIEGKLVGRPVFDAVAPVLPGFVAPPAFVF